ncbi:MAG: acetyl-CoA carboxylase, carboxyltransferase subunit beta [Acidobacteriota bacterium]
MAWFRKTKQPKTPIADVDRPPIPEGVWVKCNSCKEVIYRKEVAARANVCPKCNYHFRIGARDRVAALYDNGIYEELDGELASVDTLKFKDTKAYKDRLGTYRKKTGMEDAILNTAGRMGGYPVLIAVMEYAFMGGSMGSVVGEKIARLGERALERRDPLIVISASGGARMQEGAMSLMQMAKISAVLARLHDAAIPYISILTDPTTGGVTASYAMLGDLNIAEPRALIGFAGPRVIEQTIRQKLPEGFQRSEFLLEHGMIDFIVERSHMRETLIRCLRLLVGEAPAAEAGAPVS